MNRTKEMEKKGKRTALKRILALAMVFMMIVMTVCACSFDEDDGSAPVSSGSGSSKQADQQAARDDDDEDDDNDNDNDRDDEDDRGSSNVTDIGAGRVRQIVLGRIPGATSGNITEFEREYEDGHIMYEGTVSYNGKEYEFAIDGSTGNILEWEID